MSEGVSGMGEHAQKREDKQQPFGLREVVVPRQTDDNIKGMVCVCWKSRMGKPSSESRDTGVVVLG
jgi:hypothetical protein